MTWILVFSDGQNGLQVAHRLTRESAAEYLQAVDGYSAAEAEVRLSPDWKGNWPTGGILCNQEEEWLLPVPAEAEQPDWDPKLE